MVPRAERSKGRRKEEYSSKQNFQLETVQQEKNRTAREERRERETANTPVYK